MTGSAPADLLTDAEPRYRQVEMAIRAAIDAGDLRPGAAIPAERTLANQLSVSRVTVRRAVDELVSVGLLTRRHGAGTFVRERVEKQFAKLSCFTEDMLSRGLTPSSSWINKSEGIVTPSEAFSLSLSPGSKIYRFDRTRYADGQAMALDKSVIAHFALGSIDDVKDSLYAALDKTGSRPVRALQKLRAVLFDETMASILGVQVGSAGLLIERRGFLADGRTVEMTASWYRGDTYDFVAELVEG